MVTFNEWLKKASSSEALDRMEAFEDFPDDQVDLVQKVLVSGLKDENSTVRLCAAESLSEFPGEETRFALREFIELEVDNLAKAFGVSSLGIVSKTEDIPFIQGIYSQETDETIKSHSIYALLMAYDNLSLEFLLPLTNHKVPNDLRTSSLNVFKSIVSEKIAYIENLIFEFQAILDQNDIDQEYQQNISELISNWKTQIGR